MLRERPEAVFSDITAGLTTNCMVMEHDMANKRFTARIRRRLSLRFGQDKPVRMAFTEDITADGLFIKTTNLYRPGTEITIELIMPDEAKVTLLGMVRWSKKVPANMIHLVKKAGIGVKILRCIAGENDFRQFLLGTQTAPGKPCEQPATLL